MTTTSCENGRIALETTAPHESTPKNELLACDWQMKSEGKVLCFKVLTLDSKRVSVLVQYYHTAVLIPRGVVQRIFKAISALDRSILHFVPSESRTMYRSALICSSNLNINEFVP